MNWLHQHIKWVMLISGALTCSMIQATIAPRAALTSMFGDVLQGPIAEIVVRNWGALIALVGAVMIYGALRPLHRPLTMIIAIVSKSVFIGLVVIFGSQYLGGPILLAVIFDAVVIALFVLYLTTAEDPRSASASG